MTFKGGIWIGTITLFIIGVVVLVCLLCYVAIADKKDAKRTETIAEWLESAEHHTCASMSGTGVVTEIKRAFTEIQQVLDIWNELYGENQELLSDQKDVERLFKLAVNNIDASCHQFRQGECSKDEFLKELDHQILLLNELLRNLAKLANLRKLGYV
ncbi:MAG: hypothetical protein Q4A25_01575 [Candidatus Saccharibacteria bacterium]|nr:hypothetical protein [Candidatus Saccharibacteria bacterium]